MTTSHLDQPDSYSGNHHLVRVREISLDTITYTIHLIMWHTGASDRLPTYCGHMNTQHLFFAQDVLKHHTVPTIGHIARDLLPARYNGRDISLCPACLSMAMCQAEMLGQRYKVKTTIQAMDALPSEQARAQ